MQTEITILPSNVMLSWTFDPNEAHTHMDKHQMVQYAGFIPDFFLAGIEEGTDLNSVSKIMDENYGYGGFNEYPWPSTIGPQRRLISSYEEDPDLDPILIMRARSQSDMDLECILYESGIIALRDEEGNSKVARFD